MSTGVTRGLAYHLNQEGHTVTTNYGAATFTFTNSPDISIFDPEVSSPSIDAWRSGGVKILGVDSWTRLLELDSSYKHAFIRALGYTTAPLGIEGDRVTISCFFNGNKFISRMLVFPYKRMMSCDVGGELDCSGYLAYFDVASSKLVSDILEPLEKFLRKAAHRGHFSVDCIINKEDVFVENVSASMSKAYITALFENTRLSKTDALLKLFDASSQPITYLEPWACGVLVSMAPYPYMIPKQPEKVTGFNPLNLKHLWLIDVAQDGDSWLCGINSGCLGYVTSRGATIQEVSRRAYRTLSNIHVESIQYRSDVGKDIYDKFNRLKESKLV